MVSTVNDEIEMLNNIIELLVAPEQNGIDSYQLLHTLNSTMGNVPTINLPAFEQLCEQLARHESVTNIIRHLSSHVFVNGTDLLNLSVVEQGYVPDLRLIIKNTLVLFLSYVKGWSTTTTTGQQEDVLMLFNVAVFQKVQGLLQALMPV
ncbi:hypothetical protein DAMA08_048440 [Martiniozyma asiatica (nom. inval.)]|nr:hypothetical protein DAMA08_048440 [Martiniozyma asiatica]